ncbi:MAG: glycosyltransferase family 4 protein [Bacteroidetes bacterium]|nr:glycosyltransferase family 4 protein [Bacteroidota bacterium]
MKRALIITYYWPPSGGAGVQRWLKFVKYLREYGWEPVVFTPENPEFPESDSSLFKDIPENLDVIKFPIWEPYNAYKRFLGQKKEDKIQAGFLSVKKKNPLAENLSVWIRGNLFIPDARKFWIKPSVRFLLNYLKDHPVDAIVSTGPPHSMHLIALGLKNRLNIPWLADFRDPWTGIDFYHQLKLTRWADKKHHRLERSVLSRADRISIVSWNWAKDFNELFARDYEVITNGFDPDDFAIGKPEISSAFELTHIGSLNRDRNPDFLWEVLAELCNENKDFNHDLRLRFIGKCDIALFESLEKHQLLARTERIDYMPHEEVLKASASSQVLMLLLNNTPNVLGIVPGKLFEYLATRRPVLCIGTTEGDSARIIRESRAGITCDFGDKAVLKEQLLNLYSKYSQGLLQDQEGNIDAFSRKRLTGRIASLLDEITPREELKD